MEDASQSARYYYHSDVLQLPAHLEVEAKLPVHFHLTSMWLSDWVGEIHGVDDAPPKKNFGRNGAGPNYRSNFRLSPMAGNSLKLMSFFLTLEE